MEQITINTWISLGGFILTIFTVLISRQKDIEQKADQNAKINYKLNRQCQDMDSVKDSLRDYNSLLQEMQRKQVGHDAEIRHIQQEIDDIKNDIHSLRTGE